MFEGLEKRTSRGRREAEFTSYKVITEEKIQELRKLISKLETEGRDDEDVIYDDHVIPEKVKRLKN